MPSPLGKGFSEADEQSLCLPHWGKVSAKLMNRVYAFPLWGKVSAQLTDEGNNGETTDFLYARGKR